MKTNYILNLIVVLCTAAVAQLHAAGPQFLKANVAGTVQTQTILAPNEGRIRTSILNNKRIFAEFQVSKADYEMVVLVNSGIKLILLPKSASANLPTITVVEFGTNTQSVIDTKINIVNTVSDIAPSTATNLFKDLDGEIIGAAHFKGIIGSTAAITNFNFNVIGHGTDLNGANGASVLRFKVTAKGTFNQAP